MNDGAEVKLGLGAAVLLLIVGIIADAIQFIAELLIIGFILDPVVSIVTTFLFWVILTANDVPMYSGKRAWAGWVTTITEMVPGFDGLYPGWTIYGLYFVMSDRLS